MKKTKTILKVVKIVGGVVISVGIGAVTANLIRATTPGDVKRFTKACIKVGSFLVAGMAAAEASKNFKGTMDSVIKLIEVFENGHNRDENGEVVIVQVLEPEAEI